MLIFHMIAAAFAVLGVYFSVKIIMGMLFPNEYLTRTVIIDKREKLLILDLILEDVRACELSSYKNSITIVIDDVVFSSLNHEEKCDIYTVAEQKNAKVIIY